MRPLGYDSGAISSRRYTRIVWICVLLLQLLLRSAQADVVFAPTNAVWRIFKGTSEAYSPDAAAWRQINFDDHAWLSASAPFYYTSTPTEPPFYNGGPVTGTVITDMLNNYTCLFLRKSFVVSNAVSSGMVTVQVAADDGFIAWLNGVEVGRTNMPVGSVAYNGRALVSIAEPVQLHEFVLTNGGPWLHEGTNVLAVQAFNWDPTSSDFGVMAGLLTTRDQTAPAIARIDPPEGATVSELTSLTLSFSEIVTNIDAADLLVNGSPAANVNAAWGTQITFGFLQPATGLVT